MIEFFERLANMSGNWTTHYKGTYEGREVEVKTYSEGGYRVSTTPAEDGEGEFSVQPGSISHVPPAVKGDPLDIDGDTIAEVRRGLVADAGFSEEASALVAEHFPKPAP